MRALLATLLLAATAFAQEAPVELSAHGGEMEVMTKGTRPTSGSLSFSMGDSAFGDSSKAYEATFGATLLQDRLWFFGTAQQRDTSIVSRFGGLELPGQPMTATSVGAKVTGNLGDRQTLTAMFDSSPQAVATSPFSVGVVPAQFLSLRYTGIVSENMFFNVSLTQHSISQP